MRVLIVISGLTFGGAERQVVLMSAELVRLGHAVLVYTLNADVPRRPELEGSGVELRIDQKRVKLDLAVILRLRAKMIEWRADVVHSFLYDADVYARLAGCGLGTPVLNSERNDSYSLRPLQRLGYRLTRHLMHGLIANSWAGAEFARRQHRTADASVHVVWNGIDLDEVDRRLAASQAPAHAIWPGDGLRRVCIVGALRPQKDHLLALRVAEELVKRDPGWRFVFVGGSQGGEGAYKERVLAQCRQMGAESYAMFTGVRRDVLEVMASCDALLVTSLFEGFPNVVLEAMACGTPVATTQYSDVKRIVPFDWQVAANREPARLADIVERCVRDRGDVVHAQRGWVEANATVRRAAESLLAVYASYAAPQPALGGALTR